jgi:hypothetical protein
VVFVEKISFLLKIGDFYCNDGEKPFGAPQAPISPLPAKLAPVPKRFFSWSKTCAEVNITPDFAYSGAGAAGE